MTDIDFTSLNVTESQEDVQKTKRATHNEIMNRHMAAMRKELGTHGGKVLFDAKVVQVSLNPTTIEQYNARRFTLRAILRDPKRATVRYPMKTTWSELYPNVPYWDKCTSNDLKAWERKELKDFAKEMGVYSRQQLTTVQDFIRMAELAYRVNEVKELNEKLQEFSYLMDKEANAIIYKGHVMKYSSRERAYLLKLGNKTLKITEKNMEKQLEVFEAIDRLEALCNLDG